MSIRFMFLLLCAMLQAGCGLLFVPYSKEVPERKNQSIFVYDADSGKTIPDARVELWETDVHANWFPPGMMMRDACDVYTSMSEDGTRLSSANIRLENGAWYLPAQSKRYWAQVTFPIGFPLGFALYREPLHRIHIQADGYPSVVFYNHPRTGEKHYIDPEDRTETHALLKSDHVVIYLDKLSGDEDFIMIRLIEMRDTIVMSEAGNKVP